MLVFYVPSLSLGAKMWTSLHFPQQLHAAEIGAALRLVNAGGYKTLSLDHYPPEGLAPGTPIDRIELVLEDVLTVRNQNRGADEYLSIPDFTLVIHASGQVIRLHEVTQIGIRDFAVHFESTHNFWAFRQGYLPPGLSEKYLVTLIPENGADSQRHEARKAAVKDLLAARHRGN